MSDLVAVLKKILRDIVLFCEHGSGLKLRRYQESAARAIIDSVINCRGDTIVIQFPRQSGKNELQAQVETYLLALFSQIDAEIVKVSPTWKPQTLNAMRRLERVLTRNLITRGRWKKESGYIFRVGSARIFFLSGGPTANVVGATASTLLECDEAQDVLVSKWDKDFSPMAASTNATRVFWGTAWTSRTLLARERRAAQEAEKADGRRRVFVINADDVAREVPAYGKFVREQVKKLGRNHPLVKTQFFGEEIDAEGGMFTAERRAMMKGHAHEGHAHEGLCYCVLVDVAGEDEGASDGIGHEELVNSGRDSTALTVVEVDLSSMADELINAPTYRVVHRKQWTGVKHSLLYAEIKAIAEHWRARYLVVDATGIGAGLASFLGRSLGLAKEKGEGKVIPFVFSSSSKSKLGWDFLGLIDSGRFKDYAPEEYDPLWELFFRQAEHCQYEVLPGPARMLRWAVPETQRDPETGELLHDDLLLSAALCAVLDEQEWELGEARSEVVQGYDPLEDLTW